ncbi:enoyl-CoA hydratase [Sporosarcina sp. P13]|uniref:enoyl-CoA hydratase/isomerase family protein n=1 Tax=Sporosarcina sp. P13 TaxID=2048263 RepID=UPI000C170048|nr:enoyl-CoA hydratase-related protein [Sporosarcina sp. P13]PIC63621.1 enoyl-CoA hydratase [Sporosarcina sp. P13]
MESSKYAHYKYITVQVKDRVSVVKLNQPEVRNALSPEMREEIRSFFTEVKTDSDVKVIVLTGEGKAFSAGGDLRSLKGITAEAGRKRLQAGHDMIYSVLNLEKPVIAAVNGVAAGAGVSLALACDVVIMSDSSTFIQSFVKVGLIPDLGSLYFLPSLIGRHRALELMLTGGKLTADQALDMGIANHVVPSEKLQEQVQSIASELAKGPALAMGLTKRVANRSVLDEIGKTLELEGFAQAMCFESVDFKEGTDAFFEKRTPVFS